MTKVLKEKSEFRPKSYLADSVSVTTNVSDRLGKLKDASDGWKNRVETKDASKFTVAAKTTSQPVQLPFTKSEVRTCVPMTEFQSADPSPLSLAKSPSMIVSSPTPVTNGSAKCLVLPPAAFSRSVSVPEANGTTNGVKVSVPKLDEDKLFDKFFTKTTTQSDDVNLEAITEGDLDAITTTTKRWVEED